MKKIKIQLLNVRRAYGIEASIKYLPGIRWITSSVTGPHSSEMVLAVPDYLYAKVINSNKLIRFILANRPFIGIVVLTLDGREFLRAGAKDTFTNNQLTENLSGASVRLLKAYFEYYFDYKVPDSTMNLLDAAPRLRMQKIINFKKANEPSPEFVESVKQRVADECVPDPETQVGMKQLLKIHNVEEFIAYCNDVNLHKKLLSAAEVGASAASSDFDWPPMNLKALGYVAGVYAQVAKSLEITNGQWDELDINEVAQLATRTFGETMPFEYGEEFAKRTFEF